MLTGPLLVVLHSKGFTMIMHAPGPLESRLVPQLHTLLIHILLLPLKNSSKPCKPPRRRPSRR